ncbi:hypothetical protein ACP70R_022659 [Stipagrostis hirtigluma subsp. patula]
MQTIAKTMAARPMTSITLAAMLLLVSVGITEVAGDGSKSTGSSKGNDMARVGDLVVEVCKNMSSDILKNKVHFDEEPCISVLRSDNRSAVAKDHGDLAIVAFDILEHHSKEIASKIDSLLHSLKVHNWTERALQFCVADYAAVLHTIPLCRNIFLDVKPLGTKAGYQDAIVALECVDRLGVATSDCNSWMINNWDYNQVDIFFDVTRHVSLAWGLIEMATDTLDDHSTW